MEEIPPDDPLEGLATPLAGALARSDWAVLPGALGPDRVRTLHAEALALDAAALLVPAAVGRGDARRQRPAVRDDRIRWLDAVDPTRAPALAALPAALDRLRQALDRATLLGLAEVEAHLACYPPGARYDRHRDRFADHDARVLSLVLYLNPEWGPADGGALRLHLPEGPRDVAPESGTLVAFLSARVEHEVLPAVRARWSVAAWFRRRG